MLFFNAEIKEYQRISFRQCPPFSIDVESLISHESIKKSNNIKLEILYIPFNVSKTKLLKIKREPDASDSLRLSPQTSAAFLF